MNNKKRTIRLNESMLSEMIYSSIRKVLCEAEYNTPTGGWDGYAYKYDQALDKAKDIDDWDAMMKDREYWSNMGKDNPLNYHPQATPFKPIEGGLSRDASLAARLSVDHDMDDSFDGKTAEKLGKAYQDDFIVKESVLERIISESIKKVLGK